MQLEFIGLILLISLVVTLHNRPYLAQADLGESGRVRSATGRVGH